jgi:hypothetical protein
MIFPDGLKVRIVCIFADSASLYCTDALGYENDIELAGILPSLDLILGGIPTPLSKHRRSSMA